MIDTKDKILVQKCLDGNTESFGVLVEKYQETVFNVAYRICGEYDDAADITQSAFVKAYENLIKYNPKYKFFSWIYRIVLNESINFINQTKKLDELNENIVSQEKTPEQVYQQVEIEKKIQDALMMLEPDFRILIVLRHFQNCSYNEIAYILDISEKKVKSRMYTARQILGQKLIKMGLEKNG